MSSTEFWYELWFVLGLWICSGHKPSTIPCRLCGSRAPHCPLTTALRQLLSTVVSDFSGCRSDRYRRFQLTSQVLSGVCWNMSPMFCRKLNKLCPSEQHFPAVVMLHVHVLTCVFCPKVAGPSAKHRQLVSEWSNCRRHATQKCFAVITATRH